ncbi:hypothetical protein R6Q59_035183 [Mikania micrantha]|uniref:Uncharacterized protein n=1 Tax=Mikania micrantha TaxID=192012 RepID=A0A5N6LBC2_9ASTR|nr:hypothetical protein E3N88_44754 [Mikania micrantha]KAD0124602.1 hypothetical protein E3N88_44756 [Mikania micrantha]KAD4586495.1 hypothetical protein E3N88_24096 [Mikania micrantha]
MNPQETPHVTDAQTLGGPTNPPSILHPTANNQDRFVGGMSFSGRLQNYSYDTSFGQPPSIGAVRPIEVSQTSGTGNKYCYGPPPSLNDVVRRDGSQTGPSFTRYQDAVAEPGMSLPALQFKKHYPNAFQKDDNNN